MCAVSLAHELAPPPGGEIWRFGPSPRLVLHVPHAGTFIDPDVRSSLVLDDESLHEELRVMTDWFTDEIARRACERSDIPAVVYRNPRSRLVIDPERLPDDIEAMAAIGMGAVYQRTSNGGALRAPDTARDADLRHRFFDPYAAGLARLVSSMLDREGEVTIVDLHSFPALPLPYERDQTALRPEVCIGTDETHTPAELMELATRVFDMPPGSMALNTPFSGTYVPLEHLETDRRVRSIMVELRRDPYMDEQSCTQHDGIDTAVNRLAELLQLIDRMSAKR
jgi:N-formylglutamate deformylase